MHRNTLAFITVLDLVDFVRQAKIVNADIKVNLLIGEFSVSEIDLAVATYKAKIVKNNKIQEIFN